MSGKNLKKKYLGIFAQKKVFLVPDICPLPPRENKEFFVQGEGRDGNFE
jgi:hypothetical protein